MASSESSDSRTNSLTNRSNTASSHNDEDFPHNEFKGWLMKRSKCRESGRSNGFCYKIQIYFMATHPRIKAKDGGRSFYIHADNENLQNDWMQAICFAKAAGRAGDNSQACVIQEMFSHFFVDNLSQCYIVVFFYGYRCRINRDQFNSFTSPLVLIHAKYVKTLTESGFDPISTSRICTCILIIKFFKQAYKTSLL
ncbi:hypothetical protein KUTeg_014130 [Tegillarca granosa]|uniref:PH domain-containing protein n=1 Tax=Tegillarca granosa TaxID=220873 RepID=A0ABQ9EY80_TEGGR|nr:hypothetical protein KUTeg_014130 [Tegillarca granosa]